jgi:hypothetical protein
MKKIRLPLIVIITLSIISCGQTSMDKEVNAMVMEERIGDAVQPPSPDQSIAAVDRKIIREGSLSFETKDVNATHAFIEAESKSLKGYIANENAWTSDDRITHNLEIRVPAEYLDILISKITANVEKLESKNISSQDVTEEFIDNTARLKAKKELENRYLEILKKAVKVEEIIAIEKELGTLRADIESVEGRLKYLNEKVSYSRLSVLYYQKIKSPFQFSSKFGDSLTGGWRNLMWFFVGLGNLWPFILMGVVILIIILRLRKRRKANKSN